MRHDRLPGGSIEAGSSRRLHTSTDSSPSVGFTFEYLRRVPDLRYLARRILLAEARRSTRDYLIKAKRSALEPADHNRPASSSEVARTNPLMKPAPLTDGDLTRKIDDMFAQALRRLSAKGDVILSFGRARPIPSDMANPPGHSTVEYPQCLGEFRLWASPPPFEPGATYDDTSASLSLSFSRISSSKSIASSKKKSWRAGLQDHDGPIDRPSPCPTSLLPSADDMSIEAFFVVTPRLLETGVIKSLNLLRRRKAVGQHGGGSPSEILTVLQKDDQWRKITEAQVVETLEVLGKEEKVWNHVKDQWSTL